MLLASVLFFASSCQDESLIVKNQTPTSEDQLINGRIIEGRYIVTFSDDYLSESRFRNVSSLEGRKAVVLESAQSLLSDLRVRTETIERTYGKAIKGFAGEFTVEEINRLKKSRSIKSIEPDRIVMLAPPPGKGPGNGGGDGGDGGGASSQTTPWGITRVGGAGDGTGKTAWVLDSGIDVDHEDLNVDVSRGFTAFTKGKDANFNDGNGHGTHVAGTIAALNNNVGVIGVAAGAMVVPVKVLDSRGSGSYSGVIDGVDHVAAYGSSGDVANMSLGGPPSPALDAAVQTAAQTGVKFALAAGNESTDANNSSPARANGANIYTVSASDINDNFASFSNYGNPPVDICAPGVAINSTWKGGGYNSISGTSMASPHVAGILLLGNLNTSGTVSGDPDGNADDIASR